MCLHYVLSVRQNTSDLRQKTSSTGGVIESFIFSWTGQVRPYRAAKRNVPGWTVGPGAGAGRGWASGMMVDLPSGNLT
jgi:hypothetical protein